jgi:hypothetical protein
MTWVFWQRVSVDELVIEQPEKEASVATAYAVFFVGLSVVTGLLIRRWPLPLLGAASFICDFWYSIVFKIVFLLATGVPVLVVGLVFGLLWDRYRSLMPLIAAHWGIDTLPTMVSFLGIDY